jgi:hypothetical protein
MDFPYRAVSDGPANASDPLHIDRQNPVSKDFVACQRDFRVCTELRHQRAAVGIVLVFSTIIL